MANPEHVKIVEHSWEAIREWRITNPHDCFDLIGADLRKANLKEANLKEAKLIGAYLREANLANLNEANLVGANLVGANLVGANLIGAQFVEANLRGANLIGANLIDANLRGANLSGAHLSGAHLSGAYLDGAHLSGAYLDGAYLDGAGLNEANLTGADLTGADLTGAFLVGATLVEANLTGATITDCNVYGVSIWNLKGEPENQSNLIITPRGEAAITVDNLEVAQFIYLMLHSEKIRHVIDSIGNKGVLIIGSFAGERKAVLHAVADELRNQHNLLPIMFEFDPLATEPTIKTLATLAHMSRFVVADLTDAKSVLQELTRITDSLPTLPVQPLLHESAEMPPMTDSFLVLDSVLEPYVYSSKESLIEEIGTKVISPAEKWAKAFEAKLNDVRQKWTPWQNESEPNTEQ